jgi:hypothetical protein
LFRKIGDRMDLTLEAIRRHYLGERSPLTEVLGRYSDFFRLFVDFQGYVEFWHLNDLIAADGRVRFYLPFDDFCRNAAPATVAEYRRLSAASGEFLDGRARRIGHALRRTLS